MHSVLCVSLEGITCLAVHSNMRSPCAQYLYLMSRARSPSAAKHLDASRLTGLFVCVCSELPVHYSRLESIRKIISALGHSLIPVGNAFVIVLLIMSVYAIIGVTVFRQSQPDAFSTWSRFYFSFASVNNSLSTNPPAW